MRKMKIVFLVAAALILTSCGGISKTVDMKYGESYKIEEEKLEGKNDVAWESEDSNIVTVSDRGTVTAKAPGKAKVLIKEGDKEIGKYTFNVTTVPIEQIILSSDSIEVENGDYTVVKYTLLPQGASDYGITWTSADESVAKVYDNGEIRLNGKSVGKTTLIATTENGVTSQCSVEVIPPSAYKQLKNDEKHFVDDILPIMNDFKNPSSVRFTFVHRLYEGNYIFEVSAQNGFGGNNISVYNYDADTKFLMKWSTGTWGDSMNADLITQAVHEKLGY